jgi:murein DD-endopeptidase MepM/ murein hydrolase activator NlpD
MRTLGRVRTSLVAAPAAATIACGVVAGPAAAADLGERPVQPGMRGDDVRQLQAWLVRLGLPVARDGSYGPATEVAVRRYEREEGIPEDAVVDRDQARQMRRDARPKVPVVAFATRTLASGRVGTDVRALQRLLIDHGVKVAPDGDYGRATVTAVRAVETTTGARVDGRVTRAEARRIRASAPKPGASGPAKPETTPAAQPVAAGGRVFPIRGTWKFGGEGAHFGDRDGAHKGEDVFANCGVPLAAAEGGKVVFKDTQSAAGNYIVIRGAESGEDHAYMHLQAPASLSKGDAVKTGQVFGAVGRTGNATACHLHFEIWTTPGWYAGGAARDPLPDLKAWAGPGGATAAGAR